jgi:RsiW-degrading membrane proteinase PrsW (M82 family)
MALITEDNAWLFILGIVVIFTLITIFFYNRLDKYDPEPLSRLAFAYFLGILSVIPALIMSGIASAFVGNVVLLTVIVAPILEEIAKAWMVFYLAKSDTFDGILDGLIYGAMVGAGFASAENFLYGLQFSFTSGITTGLTLTVIRSLTQILGHPMYTGLTGAGVAAYKSSKEIPIHMRKTVGVTSKYNQLWRAILLHALWNGSASLPGAGFVIAIGAVIIISVIVLRYEVQLAVHLDKVAHESGYYDRKRDYIEYMRRMPVQYQSSYQNPGRYSGTGRMSREQQNINAHNEYLNAQKRVFHISPDGSVKEEGLSDDEADKYK